MLDEFVKLTNAEICDDATGSVYLLPETVKAMYYNDEDKETEISLLIGEELTKVIVRETPGEICAKCDEAYERHWNRIDAIIKRRRGE